MGRSAAERVLDVAGHRLVIEAGTVRVDEVPVHLSGAPLAVLLALARRPGHVVARRDLMEHLPSGEARSEHAVEMAVARLRHALGGPLVQTVVKRGYRLATPA